MRLYCAPMEGITGYVYRGVHRRCFPGVDKYFMPFLSPRQDHAFTRRELRELLPEHNRGVDAVPQLLTRRAEDFLWAAGELAAMGYREVNLNLGCPSGTVVAKGKGAGLLGHPEELERFLDAIFSRAGTAISVKTRLGLRDPEEFGPLLELFNRYPIAELTVHPRVREDYYRRPVRREAFAAALPRARAKVCYNGDLVTARDVAEFQRGFPGVEAVMLGRGLIADPALAAKARGGAGADRETLRAFHDALYRGYSEAFGSPRSAMLRMKELWGYLLCLFADHGRHGKALKKAADPAAYEAAAAAVFRDLPLLDGAAADW